MGKWKSQLPLALEHAAQGQPVYPLRYDRAPLTANGAADATINCEVIRDWWGRWPSALVGGKGGHV